MGVAREEILEAQRMAESAMAGFKNAISMLRKHQQLQAYKHMLRLARDRMESLEREIIVP